MTSAIIPRATDRYDRDDQDRLRRAIETALAGLAAAQAASGVSVVAFTATPTFDASKADTFYMLLTANVTSSTLINVPDDARLVFVIQQDGPGAHTFVWPTNVKGAMVISGGANTVSAQVFVYLANIGNAYAVSPGVVGM